MSPSAAMWLGAAAGLLTGRLFEDAGDFARVAGPLAALLILILGPYALVVLVLLAAGRGGLNAALPSRGELERLVELKHRGVLRHRPRRSRESQARTLPPASYDSRFLEARLVPYTAPEEVLDRLLRQKHQGAWAPPTPGATRPPT